MKPKIRFALIGCGRISSKHIEAIARNFKSAELVALCDIKKQRAIEKSAEYAELAGSPELRPLVFSDVNQMLKKVKIDVLSVCTPSGLHPKHGAIAAKNGVNVISEKPMATTLREADELIKECDKAGVKLFVVKQNRLNPTMQLLKQAVDQKRFGKIYMIIANVFWTRPQSYYDQAKWRGTLRMDGGAFMNQASHYVDAMQWLAGEASEVTAISGTLSRKIETEDTGSAAIKFKNGAIGSLNVTVLTYPNNFEGSITVFGEKGTVKVGGIALNKIEKWEFSKMTKADRQVLNVSYQVEGVYGSGHVGYYKNVLNVLANKAQPDTDGNEGRKSLEIIQAIHMSVKKSKNISLPIKRSS